MWVTDAFFTSMGVTARLLKQELLIHVDYGLPFGDIVVRYRGPISDPEALPEQVKQILGDQDLSVMLAVASTLSSATVLVTITESLPHHVRSGSLSLIYAISISIFGGSTQFMVNWLTHITGNTLAPAWYMVGGVAVGLTAILLMPACLIAAAAVAAAKAANMRVAAIPDTRFVDPLEYENEADYVLGSLSEIPGLIRRISAAASEEPALR